jgi:hypothetical protein
MKKLIMLIMLIMIFDSCKKESKDCGIVTYATARNIRGNVNEKIVVNKDTIYITSGLYYKVGDYYCK